jgi:hypothetical protein
MGWSVLGGSFFCFLDLELEFLDHLLEAFNLCGSLFAQLASCGWHGGSLVELSLRELSLLLGDSAMGQGHKVTGGLKGDG